MFRRLAINTGITAGAFVVTSAITLALVPMLVGKYGLEYYGLIVLARIFLPSATFAIFDFGYSEISTQLVAKARVDGDWNGARRQLFGVLLIASVVATIVGLLFLVLVPTLVVSLHTPAAAVEGYRRVLYVTAVTFIPLLVGMVADGVVKGFEAFRALRAADVSSTVVYAAAALYCVRSDLDFVWIAIAYNASLLVRLVILIVFSRRHLPRGPMPSWRPTTAEWSFVRQRCRVMVANRWLGVSQHHLAPMLAGLVIGPASAALLDVIIRLPRFAKVAFGVLNSAVLPVAARLESAGQSMRRLGEVGLIATGGISIPVCVGGMTFSAALLSQWVGPEYASYAFWQALMFMVPILNTIVGFGGMMMIVRPDVVRAMNKIVLLQLVLQYGIAFATVRLLSERAFILGQVAAIALTFFLQAPILAREKGMPMQAYLRLLPIAAVPVVLAAACVALGLSARISSVPQLFGALAAWMVVNYALLWFVALKGEERGQISGLLFARARQNPDAPR